MNYQHVYHAGSAADVFKHTLLLSLLTHFKQKDKPFCVIDTHAGAGQYHVLRQQEWHTGIGLIHKATVQHPLLQYYQVLNQDLTRFAGSPWLIKQQLRTHDSAIFIEQAEMPFKYLQQLFWHDKQVQVHQRDAWTVAAALLPPPIRRGLVLIDPPYEQTTDFAAGMRWLNTALSRWSTATYLLWYPIKVPERIQQWHRQLQRNLNQPFLVVECFPWPDDVPTRLNGSGAIIVNPPWQWAQTLTPLLDELMDCLRQHPKGKWRMQRYQPLKKGILSEK